MFLCQLIRFVTRAPFAKSAEWVAEDLALRQQPVVFRRQTERPRLRIRDRVLWVRLAQSRAGWRESLIIAQPATGVTVATAEYPQWAGSVRC